MLEKCLRADQNAPGNPHAKNPKIQILIDAQTKYEEKFGKIVDRSARCDALIARYTEHQAKSGRGEKLKKDHFTEVLISIPKEFQK